MTPNFTPDDLRYFDRSKITDDKLKRRMFLERAIIRRFIELAFQVGYALRAHDTEEWLTKHLRSDVTAMMDEIQACDEELIYVYRDRREDDPVPPRGRMATSLIRLGHIMLVYGNDGWDVIADHTTDPATQGIIDSLEPYREWLELTWAPGNKCVSVVRNEQGQWTTVTASERIYWATVYDCYEHAVEAAKNSFPDYIMQTSHYDPIRKVVSL